MYLNVENDNSQTLVLRTLNNGEITILLAQHSASHNKTTKVVQTNNNKKLTVFLYMLHVFETVGVDSYLGDNIAKRSR